MGVDVTLECCSIPLEGHKGVFYHLSLHCLSIPAKHQLFKVNWCPSLSVDRLDSFKQVKKYSNNDLGSTPLSFEIECFKIGASRKQMEPKQECKFLKGA